MLDKLKELNTKKQKEIQDKLKAGQFLTNDEIFCYEYTQEDEEVAKVFKDITEGKNVPGFNMNDFLASPQAKVLIPKTIIGTARKAEQVDCVVSSMFKKIKLKAGQAVMFPSFGVMKAHEVAEGQEIPEETIDWQTHTNNMIKVGKFGIRIAYSKELWQDCEFDIVGMLVSEAGRAMARMKEERAFTELMAHGWTVFDNDLYKQDPVKWKEARTTGIDYQGNYNGTMSIEDFLDLIIAVYNNRFTVTDLIVHPLAWVAFAKTGMFGGGFSAPYDREMKRELPNGSFGIGPNSMQGRLPFSFNVTMSPYAPIDKKAKTYNMFAVDRNNIGTLIQKQEIVPDTFQDFARDLTNLKLIERYGYGILHEGRAIACCKNVSMDKSYSTPERVILVNK